jgi:nitrite reductase (NADH) large subunit
VWEQAVVLADVLCGTKPGSRYRGSKLYTRLKVAGVDVASMGCLEPELESDQIFQIVEERKNNYRKLIVRDGRLIGAMLVGNTLAAASLLQLFDRDDPLPEDPLEVLCAVRTLKGTEERTVCNCHKVTEKTLIAAIEGGAETMESLCSATKAGTGCGSCKSDLRQLITRIKKPPVILEAAS